VSSKTKGGAALPASPPFVDSSVDQSGLRSHCGCKPLTDSVDQCRK